VLPRLFALASGYSRADWVKFAAAVGATVVPPAEAAAVAAVEKPKVAEKPKDASLEDLLGELDRLKRDSGKPEPIAAPSGPPYCPAYLASKLLDLVGDAATAQRGARRLALVPAK
jgi:hypothetical protein